jgi:SPX domain protein involved in polyphosphate accumulation
MKREKMFALEREQSVSNLSDSFMISYTTFGEELYELKKFAGLLNSTVESPYICIELNVMGFKKIIKKYNKHRPHAKLTDYYQTKVQVEPFCTQTKLDSMITKVKEGNRTFVCLN